MNAGINKNIFDTSHLANHDIITCSVTPDAGRSCILAKDAISNSIVMVVNNASATSVNVAASRDTICKGEEVTFTATTSNAGINPSYQWQINGHNTGSNSKKFNTSALQNGDMVSCIVTPDYLSVCSNTTNAKSENIVITVKTEESPSINITASANNVCEGERIDFKALAQNAGTSPSYQWKVNNVNIGNNSPFFSTNTLSNSDTLSCILLPGGDKCSVSQVSSNTIINVINPLPVIGINPADTTINPGNKVYFNTTGTANVASYEWSPSDQLENPLILNPSTVILTENTSYTLTAESKKGCKSIAKALVKIARELAMPNAFTPNRDGVNDVFRIPPGIILKLDEFSIYNIFGNRVFTTQNTSGEWDGTYKGQDAIAGVYVYIIKGIDYKGRIFAKGTVILIR
jgi:gliding motility-associated-like protein